MCLKSIGDIFCSLDLPNQQEIGQSLQVYITQQLKKNKNKTAQTRLF